MRENYSKNKEPDGIQKLCIPIVSGFKVIATERIIYLEANSNYTTIFLTNNHRFVTTKSLGEFENKLFEDFFFRCHRTYIINLNFVDEFNAGQNASIILTNQKQLPLARSRRKAFLQFFHYKI